MPIGDSLCTPDGIKWLQNDAECSNGSFCDLGTGACIECRGNVIVSPYGPFADGLCDGCNPALGDLCPDGQSCLADGTCGQCASSQSCPISAPYCNDETNLCEGCVSESDCQEGYRCFENLCRECTQPGVDRLCQSPNAPICDVETYTCRACVSDEECGEYAYCYQGACRGCSPSTNLGCEDLGRICNPNGFSCGACTLDDQCAEFFPDAPYCNLQTGVCGACALGTNRGCLDGSPICTEVENGVVCQPCTDDASCSGMAGAICDEGRCVACADNGDCEGQVCVTVSGSRICAECNPEAALGENRCPNERPQCGGNGVCVQCETNEHCARDEPICEGNICRRCEVDADCAFDNRVCARGRCRVCDGSRSNPDDPSLDFSDARLSFRSKIIGSPMYSITYRSALMYLLISCLPGCGEEKENRVRATSSSTPVDSGQARDGGHTPTDAGMPDDASAQDDASVQDDAAVVVQTVSSLSAEAWSQLCTSLAGTIQSADRPDQDLKFGYCVGQDTAEVEDYASVEAAECGEKILECIDGVGDAYQPPLAMCENTDEPPADCEISADEFDSCMRQLTRS